MKNHYFFINVIQTAIPPDCMDTSLIFHKNELLIAVNVAQFISVLH